MKFATAFGIALGASVMAAYADPPPAAHMMMRHHLGMGMDMDFDTNHDGWLSRAEASAAADAMFDRLDANHDGRLTSADRPHMGDDVDVHIGGPGDEPMPDDRNCTRTVEPAHGGDGQRVTIICNGGDEHADGGRRVERRVIVHGGDAPQDSPEDTPQAHDGHQRVERDVTVIVRGDDNDADEAAPPAPPEAPRPPRPPHPPMFMMLMASSDEADRNGDGALSREEFRAQQLRFFDASDANGDGRIRFERPPFPPAPLPAPVAPTPPPAPR
jgi:hypothetical protein